MISSKDANKQWYHKPQFVAVFVFPNEANVSVFGELQPLEVVQRLPDGLAFVLDVFVGIEES